MHPFERQQRGRSALGGARRSDPVDATRRIGGLIRLIAARDPAQLARSGRIARLAWGIAGELHWEAGEAFLLQEAALLQDIGTLYAPGRPRGDPDPTHPLVSAMMTADVLLPRQLDWIRAHHERWDGSGYPAGLRGEEIPLGAALIGVADAWHDLGADAEGAVREQAFADYRALAGVAFAEPAVTGLLCHVGGPPLAVAGAPAAG